MRIEHHLVGGYVRYISPHIIIIINHLKKKTDFNLFNFKELTVTDESKLFYSHE